MKNNVLFLLLIALLLSSCGSVPITGRKQLNLVSDAEVLQASLTQYASFMKTAKISTQTVKSEQVTRVGRKIAAATEAYLNYVGLSNEVKNFQWEFNLVKDNQINAFCMPGGKIVVYEGILPVTQDEASLAIVLGHEIAHAVAKHSAERLSNEYKKQYGAQLLGVGVSAAGLGDYSKLISIGASLGSQLWTSGFSRSQESEADHMGLIFAAMAGYDPRVATTFWQRMASQGTGSTSIFSDHPSDATRIKQIQGWMPEALKYYRPATTTSATTTTSKGTTKKSKKSASTGFRLTK